MANSTPPPICVLYGEEDHLKAAALTAMLDELLPPGVDRSLALSVYEGGRPPDQGGPMINNVLEELATLPFLADRRVVLIRDADAVIAMAVWRERLEAYLEKPARTGTLILECRSFPKNLRLHKAAAAAGRVQEFKRLYGENLVSFANDQARDRGHRLERAAAARLIELAGPDTGMIDAEVEKLCLYTGERTTITEADVVALVGQSREEKIFACADAAALGRLPQALRMWEQVLETDPEAVFRAVGGLAYVLRRWLAAHLAVAAGQSLRSLAPQMMMYGRERELEQILRRLPPRRLRGLLAALAELDAQAKSGARTIERGIELLLARLAAAA